MSTDTDEFEIKATSHKGEIRVWTRSRLDPAKSIADQAVEKLGYDRAEVVNTYGGHRSDPLYVKEKSKVAQLAPQWTHGMEGAITRLSEMIEQGNRFDARDRMALAFILHQLEES